MEKRRPTRHGYTALIAACSGGGEAKEGRSWRDYYGSRLLLDACRGVVPWVGRGRGLASNNATRLKIAVRLAPTGHQLLH